MTAGSNVLAYRVQAIGKPPQTTERYLTLADLEPVFARKPEALEGFVDHVGPILLAVAEAVASCRGISPSATGDLVHETWLKLFDHDFMALRKWDAKRAALTTYVRVFAYGRMRDMLRRNGRLVPTEETGLAAQLERSSEGLAEDLSEDLEAVLLRFEKECTPEDWRLLRSIAEGRDIEELTSDLGVSAATLYKRRQRLRDRLLELCARLGIARRGKKER